MKKLSNLIRLARKKKGNMPMAILAQKAGISYGVLQKIESGNMKTYPDKTLLFTICQLLDIAYEDAVNCLYDFKSSSQPKTTQVPLYPWPQLYQAFAGQAKPTQHIHARQAHNGFASQVPTQLQLPHCRPGDTLLIEPTQHFKHQDWVLFHAPNSQLVEVMLFEKTAKGNLLRPFCATAPVLFVSQENKAGLRGMVTEVFRPISPLH